MAGASLLRALTQEDIVCPAGEALAGEAVYCGVEQAPIQAQTNARTVEGYCSGCYTACPSWRAHKEAYWQDKHRHFDRVVERGEDPGRDLPGLESDGLLG